MLAEYSRELSQQRAGAAENSQLSSGTSGSGSNSGLCRHLDGAVYISACATKMDTIVFMHKWSVAQFSAQQELSSPGDFIESNMFGSIDNDYRFRLKLFPCGKDEECRGYLSLFLQIFKCPSAKLRFRVNFYIEAADGPRGCALNKNVVTINRGGIVTASKFFSTETLKSRVTKFLPDDVLTVGVELTVYGDYSCTDIEPDLDVFCGNSNSSTPGIALGIGDEVRTRPEPHFMGRDLGQLLDSGDFSDFTLHVGRRSFKCHKAILSARSPFFQAMFRDQSNQESLSGEVNLEDVTPETMACVLEYIYKDNCSESSKRTLEILAAADRFCLDRLKSLCQEALIRDLSPNNFCERLRAADMYNASVLKWKILNLLQKHRNYIVDNEDWVTLENECPYLAATVARHMLSTDSVGNILSSSIANMSNSNHYNEAMSVKRPRLG
ncbi:BTB/POZ domain-containing protein [Loa loa]|uniref:BTB/POZ domain-containing protein n=1 Tax=Loa loa TaxID=7209 RepID=A0A1I7VM54_LOALO|nr:BTB/POZ domain-containing protein [Loa loa]EFO25382.1 BTB/POZ domain-containing protein [Loa loa]